MNSKNIKETRASQNINSGSKERVILAVKRKFNAIQTLAGNQFHTSKAKQNEAMEQQENECNDLLQSLEADNALKAMLATQMTAIHDLQQKEFLFAVKIVDPIKKQYHINAITKLSNIFIQQVNLMHKLQGKGQQKVTVEHVHINDGGKAIIGNVETSTNGGYPGEK